MDSCFYDSLFVTHLFFLACTPMENYCNVYEHKVICRKTGVLASCCKEKYVTFEMFVCERLINETYHVQRMCHKKRVTGKIFQLTRLRVGNKTSS